MPLSVGSSKHNGPMTAWAGGLVPGIRLSAPGRLALVLPFFERIKAATVIANLSFVIYTFVGFIKDFGSRRNSNPSPLTFGGGKDAYDNSTQGGGSREALRRRGQKPLPMPKMPGRFGGEEKKLEQPQAWVYEKDN